MITYQKIGFKSYTQELRKPAVKHERVDWNSIFLLLLLIIPTAIMAAVLLLWPDIRWVARIPYAATGILGSFATVLLAVFITARYQRKSRVQYISAGLIALGIINAFQAFSPPNSNESVWLHSLAGISAGFLFLIYIFTWSHFPRTVKAVPSRTERLLGGSVLGSLIAGGVSVAFSTRLPAMAQNGDFTLYAWMVNAVPVVLFLFAGISLFRRYRQTGANELFLFTAILIFLFQAGEVFYFALPWTIVWWLWLVLQVGVYFTVLGYVLKEHIQTSTNLALEIEERNKVEVALRKAEADWRNSFNSLEDIMLIVDRDYVIENINNSGLALLGRSKEETIGRKCYQVFHGEDEPGEYCPLRQALEGQKLESLERYDEIVRRQFSVRYHPIIDKTGEVTKFIGVMCDITKQVEAEAKEKILQQELNLTSRLASIGEVAAGITHEINNPLTSVIGFAQMLTRMDVPEDVEEAVQVINEGATRIARIVDKLLTFARRRRPDKEFADIASILTNTLEMRAYEMHNNNIEVTTRIADDLPRTMANVGQLQQVFLNIIINAEQAMMKAHNGGNLRVEVEQTSGNIRVTLADDGPGISDENLSKLFDPFFTTKGNDGGTGLGLSISYGIVKEHGGKIYAESPEAGGARFIIELPITDESEPPKITELSHTEAKKVTGARIMVVDDEPHICRAMERLLSKEGYEVETVSDARMAMQMISSTEYDLIMLDIKMPGMSGIELYNYLKQLDQSIAQKVLCITGDVSSVANKAFLDETGIPCIAKPFGLDELKEQVQLVLGGKTNNGQT